MSKAHGKRVLSSRLVELSKGCHARSPSSIPRINPKTDQSRTQLTNCSAPHRLLAMMGDKMSFFCRIYVDEDEIYSGDLIEVPEKFRKVVEEGLSDWADSLGRRGLNELVYSLFSWYNEKGMFCERCESWGDEEKCSECRGKLKERFVYGRNKKLDLVLTCVGMISRIEVSE